MRNLHPLIIHFPIALLTVGVLCDFLGSILKRQSLTNTGWWAQLFGILGIAAAVTSGFLAEASVGHNDAAHTIMEKHKFISLVSLGFFAILFIWRSVKRSALPAAKASLAAYFVIGLLGVSTMLYGAHWGGHLVYDYGIGGSAVKFEDTGHDHDHSKPHDHGKPVTAEPGKEPTANHPQGNTHIHADGKEHTH